MVTRLHVHSCSPGVYLVLLLAHRLWIDDALSGGPCYYTLCVHMAWHDLGTDTGDTSAISWMEMTVIRSAEALTVESARLTALQVALQVRGLNVANFSLWKALIGPIPPAIS